MKEEQMSSQAATDVTGVDKAVEIVSKSVNVALAPLSAFIWSYEKIKEFVSDKVSDKLKGVPPEDIVPPKPHIAVPAIEALRYTGAEEELSNLYANLLASSMDVKTVTNAHPSFVEIIKQLTPDEAKLMKYFSTTPILPLITARLETGKNGGFDVIKHFSFFGEESACDHVSLVPSYLDNLSRLGLIKIPDNYWYTDDKVYDALRNHPNITSFIKAIEQQSKTTPQMASYKSTITKKQVQITELGRLFIQGCVNEHRGS